VEGDGDGAEHILVHGLIVILQIDEQRLLVAEMEVVFELVVELDGELLVLVLLLLDEARPVEALLLLRRVLQALRRRAHQLLLLLELPTHDVRR